MNYDVYCIICREKLLSGNDTIDVIREKGLKTIKTCSAAKRDGLEELLGELTNIRVHSNCRKLYTRKRSYSTNEENDNSMLLKSTFDLTSPAKRSFCEEIDNPGPSTSSFNSTLAPLSLADKENIMPSSLPADKCFFCDERITNLQIHNELKKPIYKRNIVFTVRDKNTKTSLINAASNRNDQFGRDVLNRIENVDLVQQKSRYHRNCYKQFFYKNKEHDASTSTIGRPKTEEVSTAMESIFNYIENHQNDSQFSLKELRDVLSDKYVPHDKTLKEELKKKYGNNIIITNIPGRTPIITFKDDIDKIIYESWSQTKEHTDDDIATVLKAAEIVRKDIRSKPYETEFYPSPHAFLRNAEKDVPNSLLYFLQTVMSYDRNEDENLKTKILSIAHAIIVATRPRSFISSIFTALATFLNKNFGSKKLISTLASLGFCSSYYQCNEFDASCASHFSNVEVENNFVQFVFDNADANIGTLDGLNTFHAMGGIQVLTPLRNLIEEFPILRVKSTKVTSDLGQIPLQHLRVVNTHAQSEKIQDVRQTNSIEATNSELIWAIARFQKIPDLPGWNGFMHEMTKLNKYDKSEIVPLPFINASPSDKNTIYSAIIEAVKRLPPGQKSCILTFDQPLYIKAREIVIEANMQSSNNIVVRLGGFHLLMSFMGSIGFIMAGSGLQDLWKLIYASASTDQMITGHAYSRAIRAHFLTQEALYHIMFSEINITSEHENAVSDFFIEAKSLGVLQDDPQLMELLTNIKNKLQNLKQNGPTAQLWIQYIELVTLIRQFIEAERTGNWKLHINTIAKMIPIFAAAGHYHYAKSAQLYLKDMSKLKEVMTMEEYEKFTNGYFTIRRSDRFWSGLWSDLTIEQTLMRNIKSPGGLTTGRGMSENVLAKWISAMPIANRVIENFFGFMNSTEDECEFSPVNSDSNKSRILRDTSDLKKLVLWLSEHPPFQQNDKIISLSTGVVGDVTKINCYKAETIGNKIIDEYINKEICDIKFRRKDRVVPLASVNSSIKVKDIEIPIEPLTLFQRISYTKKSQEEFQDYFTYELAPYPLSLFDDQGMRKGKKSSMYDIFTSLDNPETVLGDRRHFVVDGGHLLHKVVWHKGDTVDKICKQYTEHIKKHYGTKVSVVFDGYPEDLSQSTKEAERSRRAKQSSAEIIFDPTTAITITQDVFLQNSRNKARLVTFIEGYLNEEGIEFRQAKEDADYLIVATAFQKAEEQPQTSVIIVGEDIDLLVIMTEKLNTTQIHNVFFLKPRKGNMQQRVYGLDSLSAEQNNIKDNILFLHAISGCDTTSALFMQGKKKIANVLSKHQSLSGELQVFKEVNANIDHLQTAGRNFIVALYGGRDSSLNLLRYKMFTNLLLKTKSNLASLPPTEAAANQHILRTYLQVQKWLTADPGLLPTNFGWKSTSGGLTACHSILDPAPQELLRLISCKCKTGCERSNCSCKKAGLKCSIICGICSGQSCTNTDNIQLTEDNES